MWKKKKTASDLEGAVRNRLELTLVRGVSMEFVKIPGGTVRMGSRGIDVREEPIHRVRVSEFWMGVTPVTQEQFGVWTKMHLPKHKNHHKGLNYPAEQMNWFEAREYCKWVQKVCEKQLREKLPDGEAWIADLPTEAQWEYACRCGAEGLHSEFQESNAIFTGKKEDDEARRWTGEYYHGDGSAALEEVGWYSENSYNETHEVGKKRSHPLGLMDLHGNVCEWCLDEFRDDAYSLREDGMPDPWIKPVSENSLRVLRGGSYDDSANWCRSSARGRVEPELRDRLVDFRVVLARRPLREKVFSGAAGMG